MNRFVNKDCNPNLMSPLALAFVGDTVYDLFVRETLLCQANRPVKKLHVLAVAQVRAQAQCDAAKRIFESLTEEEKEIFHRGRNAHTGHIPKNASVEEYHYATALETVFGYLYLKGEFERLRVLFELIHNADTEENSVK